MKRAIKIIFALVIICAFAACGTTEGGSPAATPTSASTPTPTLTPTPTPEATPEPILPDEINIAVLRGPSVIGSLRLIENAQNGETINNYNIQILGAPDEIPPMIAQGTVDIAAVPTNLASVLYNATSGGIRVLALSTMGVLHLVDSTGEIESIEDLRGRTIHLSGLGAAPEFVFNYVLRMNGIEPGIDIDLQFHAEQPQIAALLAQGAAETALLPEPFATIVTMQNENIEHALDLTEEWNRIQPDYGLVMTAIIVRTEFLEKYPEAVEVFLQELEASIYFSNNSIEYTAELAVDFDIVPNTAIAVQAIPRSNQVFITGERMRQYLSGYLGVLYEELPASVGGALPDEEFYFVP